MDNQKVIDLVESLSKQIWQLKKELGIENRPKTESLFNLGIKNGWIKKEDDGKWWFHPELNAFQKRHQVTRLDKVAPHADTIFRQFLSQNANNHIVNTATQMFNNTMNEQDIPF